MKKYIETNPIDTEGKTFGEVIDQLKASVEDANDREKKKILPTDGQQKFIDNHPDDYEFARNLPYDEFVKEHADKDQLVDDKKHKIVLQKIFLKDNNLFDDCIFYTFYLQILYHNKDLYHL